MRKISIVQRRLETGLDLTQAELRALQREARFESESAEESESILTAVEDPLSFLPPTRPVEDRREQSDENGQVDLGSGAEDQELFSPESEGLYSNSGEELRSAVNEIFAGEDFSFGYEFGGEDQHSNDGTDANQWQSQGEILPPSGKSEEVSAGGRNEFTVGENPAGAEFSPAASEVREETLVLFLLQVPRERGLAATFSAAESENSPFAGRLTLSSGDDDSSPLSEESTEFDVNLPPKGLVRLSTGRVGNNGHEWALISLDEEAQAYATFDLRAGRHLKATAAVFSKSPSRKASMPVQTTESEDKGFVVANPTARPVVIRLTLLDEEGRQMGSIICPELDPLPAGKQVAVFAKGVFSDLPEITSFKGRMVAEVVGEGLIWTAGLSQNNGMLSFLPVAEIKQSSRTRA